MRRIALEGPEIGDARKNRHWQIAEFEYFYRPIFHERVFGDSSVNPLRSSPSRRLIEHDEIVKLTIQCEILYKVPTREI